MTQSSVWATLRARSASAGASPSDDSTPHVRTGIHADPPEAFEPQRPEGWSDRLTGTDGPRFWDRIVASEEARRRRYGHPVTVAVVEVVGLRSDGSWLGQELALQVFVRAAHVLAKGVRTSDYAARIGPTRFGILLIAADEISAINFIDRLRAACRAELGPDSEISLRTGWASPGEGETLDVALQRAATRLDDPAFQGAA